MRRRLASLAVAILALAASIASGNLGAAHAQGSRPGDAPGRFDYYLLALSWSPSFCANPEMAAREPAQCSSQRRFSFVVHGLWPQKERGWPQDCPTPTQTVPSAVVQKQLDIMPSPNLVEHQWDKHGACSGLTAQGYFDLTRQFRTKVIVPPQYAAPTQTLIVTGAEVETAFMKANPGLKPDMVVVTCDQRRIREVRICFTKDGRYRSCSADVRDRCGTERRAMPPTRGK
ncbi:MAG: ribonuclease T2 family protein [Caulobacterales bacterium]|jgi:ribonuclease T2